MTQYTIGVDVGGTKIAAAIADDLGTILARNVTPTEAKKGGDVVVDQIVTMVQYLLAETGCTSKQLKNIVLGIPGQLNHKKGLVINAPNISGWTNYPVVNRLKKSFQKTAVILVNDAQSAAMGELYFGAGKNYHNIIFMTVSTGIGGGLILNKQLYSGAHRIAGEVGHMVLNLTTDDQYKCACGRHGCLEAYASGINMARRAGRKLKELTVISEYYGGKVLELSERNGGKITSIILSEAAGMSDQFAIEAIEENGYYLGIACSNLINIFDPEAIVIGGGVSQIGKILFDSIRKTTQEHVKMTANLKTAILPATTGTDAGILGAVAVGLSK